MRRGGRDGVRLGRMPTAAMVLAVAGTLTLGSGSPPLRAQELPEARGGADDSDPELTVYGAADFRWRIRALDEAEATTLERFRGQVLFINVWASWCAPCVREMASIEGLRDRLADADVTFLVVAAEGEGPVRRFLRRYRYDLPVFIEHTRMPSSFGLRGLPTTWVVDRDGSIVLLRHGEAVWDTDEVEAFVRAVAAEP